MKKSTKVISMVIAVTLVMAIMTFVIYAATAGKVGINASVSWTAQAGVDLEFWGKVSGGDTTKEITKTYINPTTTNATAKIVDDLSCNFSDNTDDGVNNPNAIVFRYYIRNKSLTPLKIQVTKYPTQAEEAGTSEVDHTPKVELSSQVGEENTLVSAIGAGYDLKAGDLFEYSVTLSMASGGTGNINADTGLAQNFDAGVTFNFTVGGNSNGTIITSVDGATPTSASSSTLVGQTLGEYLATRQTAEYSTGWFFDEGLTKVVSDDYLSQDLKDSSASSFYNKTASITGLTFTLSSGGNSYLVAGESTTSPSGEVVIPNMYNGKPVSGFVAGTSPSDSAFKMNSSITSVVLSNKITSIVDFAFIACVGITNINIHNNVETIGEEVFESVGLTGTLVIPDSVTSIGNYAFASCGGLTSVIISDSVTSIGNNAFNSCDGLKSVILSDNLTSIEGLVFNSCNNLISIEIPQGVTSIGNSAFSGCGSLTNIEIPNSVKTIGSLAFENCAGLTNIEIPKSVTSIGYSAFNECSGLTNIVVANGNKKYDSRNNCNAIIETSSNTLISGCKNTIIPNTVTSIGDSAFIYCVDLTSIEIPNSVTSIGSYAFYGCSGLTSIEIPNGVTSIGSYAFYGCSGLTSIEIPNGVTSIGYSAFEGCSGLTNVTIENSVTSIGAYAFKSCTSLTNVFIPKSVTTIDATSYPKGIFYNCSSNLKIYCEASSKPDGWGTYWNYYDSSNQLSVTWGVTRAQFDAL